MLSLNFETYLIAHSTKIQSPINYIITCTFFFQQFLNVLISPTMNKTKGHPNSTAIKTACLFGGPLVTYRAFKQSGPRGLRGIANLEFTDATKALEESDLGKLRTVQVRFASNPRRSMYL